MYRTKYEICSMKLRYAEWERILFHIDEVDQILDAHLAIFTVVQHDIAQLMTLPETAKVISYQTFCRLLQEGGHECLARLVMFFINVGAKGRKEQFSELVETLRRFHDDLRGLIYGARGAGRPARRAREKRRTNLP
jgi:hypothetical protein